MVWLDSDILASQEKNDHSHANLLCGLDWQCLTQNLMHKLKWWSIGLQNFASLSGTTNVAFLVLQPYIVLHFFLYFILKLIPKTSKEVLKQNIPLVSLIYFIYLLYKSFLRI